MPGVTIKTTRDESLGLNNVGIVGRKFAYFSVDVLLFNNVNLRHRQVVENVVLAEYLAMRLAVSAKGRAGTASDRQCVTGTRKIGVVEDATFLYLTLLFCIYFLT